MIYRMVLGCSYDVSPPWGVISECLEQFRGSAHGHTFPLKEVVDDIHLSENPHRELTEFWVENYLTWDSLVMSCHAEVNFTICEHLPLISIDILMIFEGSYPLRILKISA